MIGRSRRMRSFADGVGDVGTVAAQLVDVGDVDHRGLHRDAEQRQEADARGDRERRAGQPQRQDAADRCGQHHAEHGDERELEVAVQREQQQEDQNSVSGRMMLSCAREAVYSAYSPPQSRR